MNSLITIMTCLYSRVLDLAKFTYEYAMVSEMLPGWNWMERKHMASRTVPSSLRLGQVMTGN